MSLISIGMCRCIIIMTTTWPKWWRPFQSAKKYFLFFCTFRLCLHFRLWFHRLNTKSGQVPALWAELHLAYAPSILLIWFVDCIDFCSDDNKAVLKTGWKFLCMKIYFLKVSNSTNLWWFTVMFLNCTCCRKEGTPVG